MEDNQFALSAEERSTLQNIAGLDGNLDSRRAAALIAIADGQSQVEAAEAAGLTEGQVKYIVRKYREQGLAALGQVMTDDTALPGENETEQLRAMVPNLNARVAELQAIVDARGEDVANGSPLRLITMVRDNIQKLTPDMQLDILKNFEGMTTEDLLDIDTWKGMAYMMTYSARFQAGQVRERVAGTINHVVPEPVQPGRLWELGKRGLDKVTPDLAKQIFSTFEDATREDLMDPDTWKGIIYMINYSIQFQAEQLKQRLIGDGGAEE